MMFNKFRTNVLPNGLGYTWSKSEGIREVAQVLQWRSEELAKNGLDQTDVLPFALQKIVQRKHYEMWRNDPQNQEMIKRQNDLARLGHSQGRTGIVELAQGLLPQPFWRARVDALDHRLGSLE